MKIAILTKDLMQPPHPRIVMECELLSAEGYEVEIIHATNRKPIGIYSKFCYFLTLTFFRWDLIKIYKQKAVAFSTVIIYDLSLLPLAKHFHHQKKNVIYETIDDNVELVSYHLTSKYYFLYPFISLIKKQLKKFEYNYSQKYCDAFIVNSDNLIQINPHKAITNYYASPFENITLHSSNNLPPAFLYLGLISEDKGFNEMLSFAEKFKIPFYLFGNFASSYLADKTRSLPYLFHAPRLSSQELEKELFQLSNKYRLIGFSLIKDVHESYAFQEANKDIDYMSLGIPFIGNKRGSTKEKIEAGCGVFHDNGSDIEQLLDDEPFYQQLSDKALKLYNKKYSKKNFKEKLLGAFDKIL